MPDCIDCKMFNIMDGVCIGKSKSGIRNCIIEIIKNSNIYIKDNQNILEIGCGKNDQIKNLVQQKRAKWFGLDPNNKSIANYIGNVKNLPFDNEFFDLVFASQTIEHWYEWGVTFDQGLSEIHRVLKLSGILLIDYPIYLHGHHQFMLGQEKLIDNLFKSTSWNVLTSQSWRKNYYPLKSYNTWNGTAKKIFNEFIIEKYLKNKSLSSFIVTKTIVKNSMNYENINSKLSQFFENTLFKVLILIKRIYHHITFNY